MKSKNRCPKCHKGFGNAGAAATHLGYSKKCGGGKMPAEKVETLPEPTRASAPAHESIPKGEKWDPNWSETEKRRHLLESLLFTWGVAKRYGKWTAVPMLNTNMSYSEALVQADKWNAISRIEPILTVRPARPAQQPDRDDDLCLALLLLNTL